jgi:thiamine-phosphate pyrophosphorylase
LLGQALDAGDVAALQIRLKDADDDTVRRATEALLPVAQARDVAVLMNDRADLAVELGCDGAHLGQEDGNHAAARRLLGPDRTLGITCHASRHLAMEAGDIGADYVAFGAFFPTSTKEAKHHAEPELLTWWNEMFELPSVAIGGITAANCAPLVRAGADFLAVVGAVWNHPEGPAAGVQAMNRAIAEASADD